MNETVVPRINRALLIWAIISGLFFVVGYIVPNCFMDPGRKAGIESVNKLLKLAGTRQFDEMVKSGIAREAASKWMRDRDVKWGKVVSYSLEHSTVSMGGAPAQITMRVRRERKNVRELFICIHGVVSICSVPWPEAEV